MIKRNYIHDNNDIERYNDYQENMSFFREEFEAIDYYSREYKDALFFNESVEKTGLIVEAVTDIIRGIGDKIISIINKVREFIKKTFQKIKTASWEGKTDERKLELLAKKNPDLAKRASIAIKEGKLKLNDFKDLNTFYRTIDEVLDDIEKSDIDPTTLKGKINKAKDKLNNNAKTLATIAGIAGSITTIYKFSQIFKKNHDNNDKSLEQMRNAAEVEAAKFTRMANTLRDNRDAVNAENLKSKSAVLAYAATQYEQVTNSAISARTRAKFSLIKAYDSAVHLFSRRPADPNAYDSALSELTSKRDNNSSNSSFYQRQINSRTRDRNSRDLY